MSVDILQEKIRKTKNPSVIILDARPELVPSHILAQEQNTAAAVLRFNCEIMEGLKNIVPAVRFSFGSFALLGPDGLSVLIDCMKIAKEHGFYVFLDGPELFSPAAASFFVQTLSDRDEYPCDAVVVSAYLGSDVLQTVKKLCASGKAVFCVVRTANRSAGELQDLMTGGRLVHTAAADIVNRHGESVMGKCGYSHMGAVAAASSSDSLRTLRSKYSRLFLLLDGYDYPNSNAKNCSFAFDKFGHGAAACAGASITGAWKEEANEEEYVSLAVSAAERMRKNLLRYIVVM